MELSPEANCPGAGSQLSGNWGGTRTASLQKPQHRVPHRTSDHNPTEQAARGAFLRLSTPMAAPCLQDKPPASHHAPPVRPGLGSPYPGDTLTLSPPRAPLGACAHAAPLPRALLSNSSSVPPQPLRLMGKHLRHPGCAQAPGLPDNSESFHSLNFQFNGPFSCGPDLPICNSGVKGSAEGTGPRWFCLALPGAPL